MLKWLFYACQESILFTSPAVGMQDHRDDRFCSNHDTTGCLRVLIATVSHNIRA